MTEHHPLDQMLADLRQSQRDLLAILSRLDERTLYRSPGENEWSPAENLVHLAEAREFFAAETSKVLNTPGITMGRTITDSHRIQNVREHAHDPSDLILRKLVTSHEHLLSLLEQMHDEDLQVIGTHVKFGQQTLAEFIEHFIVEHDQTHVRQINALFP